MLTKLIKTFFGTKTSGKTVPARRYSVRIVNKSVSAPATKTAGSARFNVATGLMIPAGWATDIMGNQEGFDSFGTGY